MSAENVTPITPKILTPQERQQAFADWLAEGEHKFGATVVIRNPITPLDDDGSFAYTPPVIRIALIEGWTPE